MRLLTYITYHKKTQLSTPDMGGLDKHSLDGKITN
jgi:hypothetical protein